MNLDQMRTMAEEAKLWAAAEWELGAFVRMTDVQRAEALSNIVLDLLDEVERRDAVVQAARGICQWLDYHADDVATWGPDARDWADELHTSVIALEEEHHS